MDNTTTVIASFATVTAAFGPPLAQGGVRGVLFQLTPADGCSPAAHADKDGHVWIALIEKGNCGFHDKVLNAQLAGAAAAVVYDNKDNQDLMLMTAQDASDIHMSSVFIRQPHGQLLRSIAAGQQQGERVTVLLKPDIDYVVPDRIVMVVGTLIIASCSFAYAAMWCLPIFLYSSRVSTPSVTNDMEDVVVVVNCEVAPQLASVVTNDGLSKLEEGEGAMKLETAPLLQLVSAYMK
eukprot:jgi/Chlat1/3566/Chrsp234S03558